MSALWYIWDHYIRTVYFNGIQREKNLKQTGITFVETSNEYSTYGGSAVYVKVLLQKQLLGGWLYGAQKA